MGRKPKKSLAERIAEAQAMQARLEAEAAANAAANRPELKTLRNTMEAAKEARTVAQRGFGNHAQSFEMRLAAKQVWIDEIEAAMRLAERQIELAKEHESKIQEFVTANADSDAPDLAERAEALADMLSAEWDAEIGPLESAAADAQSVRKNFTADLRAPKRKTAD